MDTDELKRRYAAGIEGAYPAMVERVGKTEADKWRERSLASAPMYAARFAPLHDGMAALRRELVDLRAS